MSRNRFEFCKKRLLSKFGVCLLILNMQNCITYLYHLGKEQTKILFSREEISKIISNPSTDENTKEKLKLIESAREFAINKLYLNSKGGFVYYTKLDRDEIGWHVTASYPLKFESYTWWFPFLGRVPYKGFFDIEKAKKLEEELIKEGLDTKLRITGGYSTLGWFSDPVMSPQLKLRKDELVSLVIHEMAHSTVYFPGDSQFNESYATFIEDIGTENYYNFLGGEESNKILLSRKQYKEEGKIIMSSVKETALKLKELYESNLPDEEKLKKKFEIIEDFKTGLLGKISLFKKIDITKFKKAKMNNENFIGLLRYNSGGNFFKKKFDEVNQDFKKFHLEMEKLKELSIEERENLLKN